jgi:hypothetical protein
VSWLERTASSMIGLNRSFESCICRTLSIDSSFAGSPHTMECLSPRLFTLASLEASMAVRKGLQRAEFSTTRRSSLAEQASTSWHPDWVGRGLCVTTTAEDPGSASSFTHPEPVGREI